MKISDIMGIWEYDFVFFSLVESMKKLPSECGKKNHTHNAPNNEHFYVFELEYGDEDWKSLLNPEDCAEKVSSFQALSERCWSQKWQIERMLLRHNRNGTGASPPGWLTNIHLFTQKDFHRRELRRCISSTFWHRIRHQMRTVFRGNFHLNYLSHWWGVKYDERRAERIAKPL